MKNQIKCPWCGAIKNEKSFIQCNKNILKFSIIYICWYCHKSFKQNYFKNKSYKLNDDWSEYNNDQ